MPAQHLALPLRLTSDGRFAALDQGSPEEIAQSVALLAATRPGERRSVPGYGIPDPLGGGFDPDVLDDAIEEWEDRADPAYIDVVLDTRVEQHAVIVPSATGTANTDAATDEEA